MSPTPSTLEMELEWNRKELDIDDIDQEIGRLLEKRREIDEKIEYLRNIQHSHKFS
jgi:hypothetical protein